MAALERQRPRPSARSRAQSITIAGESADDRRRAVYVLLTTTAPPTKKTAQLDRPGHGRHRRGGRRAVRRAPPPRCTSRRWKTAPAMTIDTAKTYTATVKTDVGTFVITLDAKDAPDDGQQLRVPGRARSSSTA